MIFLIALAVVVAVLFVIGGMSVRIVRPYQRGLVERLGRYHATVEPGMRLIMPVIDRLVRVDMRETVVEVPPQEVITSDNVVVKVYAVVYYEATDPQRLVYNVADFVTAVTKLAQTNLRNVIGDLQLDDALVSSEAINTRLRDTLDDATDKWGSRVVRVEIQRIDPPPDVVSAMHHQMQAERHRRAQVTEALGEREAAVTRAEGEKSAAILGAEGTRQAAILEAQGAAEATVERAKAERFRRQTEAEGEADAIRSVYRAIHDGEPTEDVLAIKYLEALEAIADGRANKIFLPTEASALLGALGGVAEAFAPIGPGGAPAGNGARPAVGAGDAPASAPASRRRRRDVE